MTVILASYESGFQAFWSLNKEQQIESLNIYYLGVRKPEARRTEDTGRKSEGWGGWGRSSLMYTEHLLWPGVFFSGGILTAASREGNGYIVA